MVHFDIHIQSIHHLFIPLPACNMPCSRYYNLALLLVLFVASLSITQSFPQPKTSLRLHSETTFSGHRRWPGFQGYSAKESKIPLHLLLADSLSSDSSTLESLTQNTDFWVFLAGIFPFAWATVEFWRRIAFGQPFGTGSDSVIIGIDDSPSDSRGRRVLGKGALVTAYILFALAFGTIGLVLYSIVSSDAPPEMFHSTGTTMDEFTKV